MTVAAIGRYDFEPADTLDKFHGNQLVYIGWDQHLMFCAPLCLPLPPSMPFGAFVEQVLPGAFGYHPEFKRVDWARAEWLKSGQPFRPDWSRSLADNGIGHKDALRLRTPGLDGIGGSAT